MDSINNFNESISANRGDLTAPNFDQFLNRSGQQYQQQNQHQSGPPTHQQEQQWYQQNISHHTIATNNKVNFDPISTTTTDNKQHKKSSLSSFGNNVRIHPTEMQRYFQGLMQSSNNGYQSQGIMSPGNSKQASMMFPNTQKGNLGMSYNDNKFHESHPNKGENNAPSSQSSSRPRSGSLSDEGSFTKKTTSSRPKNDKSVEVIRENQVIARFRTQTECARYLRATPEAVSYHCSKGGGTCNGLTIRPLNAELLKFQQSVQQDSNQPYYGLFEGATEFRPAKRPQLKPETVAILKDWLLHPDHVDNPYPNQRETEMLMEQTGLDKTQLKHWFNNARKRILKPLLKNGQVKLKAKQPESSSSKVSGSSSSSKDKTSRKKRRKSDDGELTSSRSKKRKDDHHHQQQLLPNSSSNSTSTHKMSSNLTSSRQQGQGSSQHQGRQFDNFPSQQGQDFRHSNSTGTQGSMNQFMGYNNNNMNGMPQGNMMGFGSDNMGMMYHNMGGGNFNSYNDMQGSQGSSHGNRGGNYQGDGPQGMNSNRYNNDYPPSRGNSSGSGPQQGYQDTSYGRHDSTNSSYSQASSQQTNNLRNAPNQDTSHSPENAARQNAIFKQQVATMAMNEASTAFKDMEDAFAQAKDLTFKSNSSSPNDDPRVKEANAHAKKLQSVAMFKLKVSQRASEEAASAYDRYQGMLEGGNGGGGGSGRMNNMGGNGPY